MFISARFVVLAAFVASANGFSPVSKSNRLTTALNSVGIYYSTSTGNTETVAGYISKAAGGVRIDDIGDAKDEEILSHDALIVGAPTWHTGADEQRSGTAWDSWLYNKLPKLDLQDKKVAIFGVGDQQSYGDNFCDAAGELYDLFKAKGCKIYGLTSQEGYDHGKSTSCDRGPSSSRRCGNSLTMTSLSLILVQNAIQSKAKPSRAPSSVGTLCVIALSVP
jgi:flavodoxin I